MEILFSFISLIFEYWHHSFYICDKPWCVYWNDLFYKTFFDILCNHNTFLCNVLKTCVGVNSRSMKMISHKCHNYTVWLYHELPFYGCWDDLCCWTFFHILGNHNSSFCNVLKEYVCVDSRSMKMISHKYHKCTV